MTPKIMTTLKVMCRLLGKNIASLRKMIKISKKMASLCEDMDEEKLELLEREIKLFNLCKVGMEDNLYHLLERCDEYLKAYRKA